MMLYIDMDGVLVEPDSEDFSRRSWRSGGRELWAAVRHLPLVLLSWGRTGSEYERILREKREWVTRELGPSVVAIVLPDTPKAAHCKPGDILIDDAVKHGEPWFAAGGVFIHHKNVADTLRQLGL